MDYFQEHRVISDIDLHTPFNLLCSAASDGFHVPQKLDAFVRYCLLSRGYGDKAQIGRVEYTFLAVFEEICKSFSSTGVVDGAEISQEVDEAIIPRTESVDISEDIKPLLNAPETRGQQLDRLTAELDMLKRHFAAEQLVYEAKKSDLQTQIDELKAKLKG
jgi:hypothetical protein